MPTLKIDNQTITVGPSTSLLKAAESLNIEIPTLCHLDGLEPFTSCMVCVVQDVNSGKLLPSCSVMAVDNMVIETNNDTVRKARKDALELLMSEHVGDCEAPCRKGCPASMNIPLMLRQIAAGETEKAIRTIKQDIALPAVMGRICSAPCEKVCNRSKLDGPVHICVLKRYAADVDLNGNTFIPKCLPASGKSVAIIGSGPAGLSAAYYLKQQGHDCTIYDRNEKPGGNLRYAIDTEKLPHDVLDNEIAVIEKLGVVFQLDTIIGVDVSMSELQQKYHAIVIACGAIDPATVEKLGTKFNDKGIIADNKSFVTSVSNIFAGGSALRESKMAIRSSAHGKKIAQSIDCFFKQQELPELPERHDSRIGKLASNELNILLQQASQVKAELPDGHPHEGYSAGSAREQAARCMHCDCRKPDSCKLRIYSREYQADPKHYPNPDRAPLEIHDQHDLVVYEPGKCIKCGICVRITEQQRETLGLSFIGRGFNVRVKTPFEQGISKALEKTALECAQACPTGAIALKSKEI